MSFKYADVDKEYKKIKKYGNSLRKEDVKHLNDWISKQEHLPKVNELKLIFFLQSGDFNLEQTKICIETYFRIRSKCPEFFTNRNYETVKHYLDSILVIILPKLTTDGCMVTIFKMLDTNLETFHFVNWVKTADMIITLHLMLNGSAKEHILILDMEGTRLGHLLRINLIAVQKYGAYMQEGIRIKLRNVHIINTSFLTEKLVAMVKPIITNGLFEAILVHHKMDTLYDYVPKDILPKEYGGNEVSIQELKDDVVKTLRENDDYFRLEAKEIVDETKRIGNLTENPLFGFDGSFKQLNID